MFDNFKSIMIKVSDKCNMCCDYCFQGEGVSEGVFSDIDDLKNFLRDLPTGDTLDVKFIGGEPLIYTDSIKRMVKEIRKLERTKDVHFRFGLTTNGLYFKSLIELIKDGYLDEELVKVSWDGKYSKYIRKSCYDNGFVNNAIYSIIKECPNVTVRIAIHLKNVEFIEESMLALLSRGAKSIELYYIMEYPLYRDEWFIYKCKKMFEKVARIYSFFSFRYINWESLKYNSDKETSEASKCSHLGSHLHIDKNGDLYPCGMFVPDDNIYVTTQWKIGNLKSGIDFTKTKELEMELNKEVGCSKGCKNVNCFECPAVNLGEIGSMTKRFMQQCELKEIERKIYNKFHGVG